MPQNQTGTGFVFTDYDGDAMLAAIDRGLSAYGDEEALDRAAAPRHGDGFFLATLGATL